MQRVIWAAALLTGCTIVPGSGISETRTLDLDPFATLVAATLLDVDIRLAQEASAEVTCDDNLLDYFEFRVLADELVIRTTPMNVSLQPRTPCFVSLDATALHELTVTASGDVSSTEGLDELTQVSVTGSGDVELAAAGTAELGVWTSGSGGIDVAQVLATDELTARISGSGPILLDGIDVDLMSVTISGSGDLVPVGRASMLDASLSASGRLRGADLHVTDAHVTIAGSGSAELVATGSVTGSLTGSGNLIVRGGADVDVSTSGTGDVIEE